MHGVGRLLRMGPGQARFNMALDEALARLAPFHHPYPTLRLYRFDPPAVSIGYFQRWDVLNLKACFRIGLDVVRRPTGGKAVLHDRELNYAIIFPDTGLWSKASVLESYQRIAMGLVLGLQALGVEASLAPRSAPGSASSSPWCFLSFAPYELRVGPKKLTGSAQRRFKGSLLQHGTLLLEFDPKRFATIVPGDGLGDRSLGNRVTSLREILGRLPPVSEVETAIAQGMAQALGIRFDGGVLQEEELRLTQTLVEGKYASQGWSIEAG
ncbi:MAG: lipoate--protein ligase family protein [candidate division NC10 bacterium]|nr:lipoate--protein ligase family protein [candidate division NC10 bacterium]